MSLTPADLQRAIAASPRASHRILTYVSAHGGAHNGRITGAVLASVCGVDSRTWRRWVGGEREIPRAAWRLLVEVSGVDIDGQTEVA